MSKVTLKSSWYEILGEKREDYSEAVRKKRWITWKKLAIENGDSDLVDNWTDTSSCRDCIHRDNDWCMLEGLPVTVNPILTMKFAEKGMACKGVGYEAPETEEQE